jgi:ectoine hydroxylase-related dioxygenase (phytanoyl-CoA dioxygenase family)
VPYPVARAEDVAFFEEHGYLVVRKAVDPADLEELAARCEKILANKERFAFDWAWEKGTSREQRAFKIVQGSPSLAWRAISDAPFRRWSIAFGAALLRRPVEFWYDQFLAKPPRDGAPTCWHQDEAYWGRNLDERGVTCWIPLQDVDERNGCMHFIDRGHRDGILPHRQPAHVQSDLLLCEPDLSRVIACPIALGDATFHHGKTPHMTPANVSDAWRRAVTTHLRVVGSLGEGDHYPWKVYVNQITGERIVPPSR